MTARIQVRSLPTTRTAADLRADDWLRGQSAAGGTGSDFKISADEVARYVAGGARTFDAGRYGMRPGLPRSVNRTALNNCLAAASAAAISSNPVNVVIPPGGYDMNSVYLAGSYVTLFMEGARLNCGANTGIELTGGDGQRNLEFIGGTFTNFGYGALGVRDDVDVDKYNITVARCKFVDSVQAAGSVIGLQLSCRMFNAKIIDNHIENLATTDTSSDPEVYGMIIGRKYDSMTGGRTGEVGSYGFDGVNSLTREGCNVIRGNTVRKLRSSSDFINIGCTGILADGWFCNITDNIVDDIQFVGAGSALPRTVAIGSGAGIYSRGYGHVVANNIVGDVTWAHIVIKDGSSSTNYGPFGSTEVAGNVLFGRAGSAGTQVVCEYAIALNNGHVHVHDNYLRDIVSNEASPNPYLILNTSYLPDVTIAHNIIERCYANNVIGIGGANQRVIDNQILYPRGPRTGAYAYRGIYYYGDNGQPAKSLQIERNEQVIDEALFAATGLCRFVHVEGLSQPLRGFACRDQKALGWGGTNQYASIIPAETWMLQQIIVASEGHYDWDVTGLRTDVDFRAQFTNRISYTDIGLTGAATYYPIKLAWSSLFPGSQVLDAGTTGTLARDESGLWIDNNVFGGAQAWQLPPAVPGCEFTFSRTGAGALTVTPNGTDTIAYGAGGALMTLDQIGTTVTLHCTLAGQWIVRCSGGSWSIPASFSVAGAAWTGFSSAPDTTFAYRVTGGLITIYNPTNVLTGTSNSTALTLVAGSLPAGIRPTTARRIMVGIMQDNGAAVMASCLVNTDGSVSFNPLTDSTTPFIGNGNWTASGTKGFYQPFSITYAL